MDKPPFKLDYAGPANRRRFKPFEFLETLPLPVQFGVGIIAVSLVIGVIYGIFGCCMWLIYVFCNQ